MATFDVSLGEGPFFFEVKDDHMVPDLHPRDYVFVHPCQRFEFDAIYLMRDVCGGRQLYVCTSARQRGLIRLSTRNPKYDEQFLSPDDFANDVVGRVAMECRVSDQTVIRRLMAGKMVACTYEERPALIAAE